MEIYTNKLLTELNDNFQVLAYSQRHYYHADV